jgi:hypothetical protein
MGKGYKSGFRVMNQILSFVSDTEDNQDWKALFNEALENTGKEKKNGFVLECLMYVEDEEDRTDKQHPNAKNLGGVIVYLRDFLFRITPISDYTPQMLDMEIESLRNYSNSINQLTEEILRRINLGENRWGDKLKVLQETAGRVKDKRIGLLEEYKARSDKEKAELSELIELERKRITNLKQLMKEADKLTKESYSKVRQSRNGKPEKNFSDFLTDKVDDKDLFTELLRQRYKEEKGKPIAMMVHALKELDLLRHKKRENKAVINAIEKAFDRYIGSIQACTIEFRVNDPDYEPTIKEIEGLLRKVNDSVLNEKHIINLNQANKQKRYGTNS